MGAELKYEPRSYLGDVVALIEEGTLSVSGETGYNIPEITIPDNIIYYQ